MGFLLGGIGRIRDDFHSQDMDFHMYGGGTRDDIQVIVM